MPEKEQKSKAVIKDG